MDLQQNYIDLKINGRLFPLWIMFNFKKYKLDPIIKIENEDPCKSYKSDEIKELRKYQQFLGAFLNYKSPYKDILLYHGLGSGKTATVINIYNILYNYTPSWNVFILIKASLKNHPWMNNLKILLSKEDYDNRMNNIKFIHYDAFNADKDFLNKIKESDSSKKNIYIIEEVHNFIKNVYNNIVSKTGRKAQIIYDYIIQEKKDNNSSRIILLSATPAVNSPYELALIFNLLRLDIFPTSEAKFKETYISTVNNIEIINPETKNMFQRRIIGLVSYYKGATSDLYAKKIIHQKNLKMDPYQLKIYKFFEDIEKKLEASRINKKGGQSTYNSYTRQACNFVFPIVGDISGETRPRPSKFNLTEKQSDLLLQDKIDKDENKEILNKYEAYTNLLSSYIKQFDIWLDNNKQKDIKMNLSLINDINVFKNEFKYKFTEFWNNYNKKSNLLKALYQCSCKMTAIMFYSQLSPGPILVYSNYVKVEGLEIFKIYMKYFDFINYNDNKSSNTLQYHKYTEFSGNIDKTIRDNNITAYNHTNNKDGSKIRIILISSAGAEGISLNNVRQVHILEPYWNDVRIEQLIGRAIRQCSHADIPVEDRVVAIYKYNAISGDNTQTTDEKIQMLAYEKNNLINTFLSIIKEVAIDCELFAAHNMEDETYNCFKFNEKSYFDSYIEPAYKDNIYYDKKIDNGSNSINSTIVKIKTFKIKIVFLDSENNIIPTLHDAWYNPDTKIVYDYELKYPIGKIKIINDLPFKINKYTYVIDQVIIIPKIFKI